MQQHIQIAGIAWFEEDDYPAFRLLLPDRDWHDTFHEWEAAAVQHIDSLKHQGIRAIKVQVRSVAFADWCRRSGRHIDTQALRDLANMAAYRAGMGEH